MFGAQSNFPSFMDAQHQVNELEDAEDYVARLHAVKTKFEQIGRGLTLREQNDIIPPQFVIDRVLVEMKEFVAQPVEQNILYTSLQEKMEKADIEPAEQTRILADAKQAIIDSVHPAYDGFIQYFESLGDKVVTVSGSCPMAIRLTNLR